MEEIIEKPIEKPVEQLTLEEMEHNFFHIFNHGLNRNLFINYIKRNNSELIRVLTPDGKINPNIKYGSPEYRAYVEDYVKKHDNGPVKIFTPDGSLNIFNIIGTEDTVNEKGEITTTPVKQLNDIYKEVLTLYSNLENNLLKAVPMHLTKIHEGDPNYDIYKEDGCEIKYPKGSTRIGIINCGQKGVGSVIGKYSRFALNDTTGLSEEEAINLKFHGKEAEMVNCVSDYARISVILDTYDDLQTAVGHMQLEFGGLPKINDYAHSGKKTYEAVHINTRIGNVNTEIQFHTEDDMRFKIIDDIIYHTTFNSKSDIRTKAGYEMAWLRSYAEACAQVIFARGTFQRNVPALDEFIASCVAKGFVRTEKPKLENFGITYGEAYFAQRDLVKRATTELPSIERIINKSRDNALGIAPDEKFSGVEM
ncbi:MAG: hypothetical protein KIG16_00120 [Eubacteriales bacterium]|nr:hypothetical protein [Eubacteriales bacterium]